MSLPGKRLHAGSFMPIKMLKVPKGRIPVYIYCSKLPLHIYIYVLKHVVVKDANMASCANAPTEEDACTPCLKGGVYEE